MLKPLAAIAVLLTVSACHAMPSKEGCDYRKLPHGDHHGAYGAGGAAAAVFKDKDGASIGRATLTSYKKGVLLSLDVDVPAGERGFHIHEKGDCSSADFKSAGGHFNPLGSAHGFNHEGGAHLGDMPNIIHDGNGRLTQKVFLQGLTLDGEHGIRGKAFIIHEGQDDYASQPTGAAGPRHACAVIE